MKKKIMAVTLCLAMVSTFAVGCGQKNETDSGKSEEKSSGKVEIEFVQVKREAAESYTKVIEAFEKENPDIVIKQNVVPDAQEVLMTRASSDSLPDMMNHWPTDAQFVQFEDEGLLLDLSEKDYMKNIDSKYLDAVKAKDGKNYIAPYNVNFMGVYYNKDKFEEAGYTMPTKWDELIALAEEIKAKGETPFILPNKDSWTVSNLWSNIEARDLGSHEDEFEKMKAGEESFETIPEYKSGVEKMIQLLDYANEDSLALGYDQAMCVKFDVIGLDSPCVDLAVNVRCFPKPNGAERIQNLSWQGGGKVASGMVAAARLGLCCGIMGNVGDDKYGTFCLRDFQDHGIDTEQMCVRKNRTTNFDIVISDEGSMGRSFVFYPGNAECMTEEELNIEYISNSSYFYMANLDSVTKKAAQMAKQKGSKIFMDADSYTDELLDAISWIDIFIGSEFVYEKMLEAGKSVKENCEYLYNKGPEIVIFTFGEKGCAGISKEGFFEIPAFDVDVKDTVGAGDVFHGAFLAAIVKGLSPKDAARFASGVAAIKCTRIGGRAGIPNWEVTDNFLETGEIDYREIDERVKKYGRGIEYV